MQVRETMPGLSCAPAPAASTAACRRSRNADQRLCRRIGGVVAAAFGVAANDLYTPNRGTAPVALARQAAIYLGHVVFGLSLTRLGRGFGRDRTTARHACRIIEELRDDPVVDQVLDVLEGACGDMPAFRARRRGRA
jgi:chromosomal replication initiation ATPase DnaA